MTRVLMIAGLVAGVVMSGTCWAEAQDGSERGPGAFPPGASPETPGAVRVPAPINTEGLDDLLPAPDPDDDGDEGEIIPNDIQDTKLTVVRDGGSQRLWVDALLVVDTNATGRDGNGRSKSLAPALRKDAENMMNLLQSIGIQPTVLQGDEVRPEAIRRHYARLRQGSNRPDVLIFYSTSHGHSNPRRARQGDRSHGHILDLNDGRAPMWHAIVRKAMLSVRPCRLAVLLTDSCSSIQGGATLAGMGEMSPFSREALRSLFLNHTGIVDINSSSLGQTSACNPYTGSLFTYALFTVIASGDKNQLDFAPRDEIVAWDEVFRATRKSVADCSEGKQVPEAFSLARPR